MHHNANALKLNKCSSAETCLRCAGLQVLACISELSEVWEHSMQRETKSILMFTPKAHGITCELLEHRTHCTPLLFITVQDSNPRGTTGVEKGKRNEDTTWSSFKGNLGIGWHLLTFSTRPMHEYSGLDAIQ